MEKVYLGRIKALGENHADTIEAKIYLSFYVKLIFILKVNAYWRLC